MSPTSPGRPCAARAAAVALGLWVLLPSPGSPQGGGSGIGSPSERCAAPEFRQFDFWVGRWEVRNRDGEVVGHNEIRHVAGGCGLLELWRGSGGGTGVSVNTYDAEVGRWTQRWVGTGATLWLEGGIEEGPEGSRMVLTGPRPRATPQGPVLDRLQWTPLADGIVRQVWEVSTDEGDSWREIFLGLYSRAGEEEGAATGAARPVEVSTLAVVRSPDDLEWSEAPTGASFAPLYGRPAEPGPFAFHMRMPAGFRMTPHWHDTAEHLTVLSGTLHMRFSQEGEATVLPEGSVVSIPAGQPMWAWTEGEATVIQVYGVGPFHTTPVAAGGGG